MSIKEDIKGLRAKQYKVIVGKTLCHFMESSMYSKASSYVVFGFRKKTCILRLIKFVYSKKATKFCKISF